MTTWTSRGTDPNEAWANRPLWKRRARLRWNGRPRGYWYWASEAEAMAERAREQAEIRQTFMTTS